MDQIFKGEVLIQSIQNIRMRCISGMLSWTFSKYIGCQKTDTVTLMGFLSHVTQQPLPPPSQKKPQKEPQME